MALRPYLKFFIAGGAVCGEGGPFLVLGIVFAVLNSRLLGSNMLNGMVVAFIVIGAISLCIGLSLLYKAVTERNLYLQREHKKTTSEIPIGQETTLSSSSSNGEKRFCPSCGKLLPPKPDAKFCLQCGAGIY